MSNEFTKLITTCALLASSCVHSASVAIASGAAGAAAAANISALMMSNQREQHARQAQQSILNKSRNLSSSSGKPLAVITCDAYYKNIKGITQAYIYSGCKVKGEYMSFDDFIEWQAQGWVLDYFFLHPEQNYFEMYVKPGVKDE